MTPDEAAQQLAKSDPDRSQLIEHPSGGLLVDPVLSVIEGIWSGMGYTRYLFCGGRAMTLESLIVDHIWLMLLIWLAIYAGDYYLTIIGARRFRVAHPTPSETTATS